MNTPTEKVWAVARAMLANSVNEDVSCGMNAYNLCRHCSGRNWWENDPALIEHDEDCVVLTARDLLKGAPDDGE